MHEFNLVYKARNSQIVDNYFIAPDVSKDAAMNFQPGNVNLTMTGNTFMGSLGFAAGGYSSASFPNNTYLTTRPTRNVIFVTPNKYEPGRATITIYNWQLSPSVGVDVAAAGLHNGEAYEVRDAENFFSLPSSRESTNWGSQLRSR